MNEEPKATKTESQVPDASSARAKDVQEFLEAGAHFGHKKSVVHPGMFPYIFCTRNNIHIIDVEKTYEKLEEALVAVADLAKNGKTILFAGTRPTLRDHVRAAAEEAGMPFMVSYWPGGTLTNWSSLKGNVERLKELEELEQSEEWGKYKKHERLAMTRELKKLQDRWGGVKTMDRLPDAVFIVDMQENALVAKEAHAKKITVIAVADTNINPKGIDYLIPANDDAVSSVRLILGKVKETILANKAKAAPAKGNEKRERSKKE
ncbi:MAG: 30S ribosomal protein S2 [Candidatus Spechtbacterales bacterium]